MKQHKPNSSHETNSMKRIKVAKITLNVGAGKDEELLKKGLKLLQKLSPVAPVKTVTKKRIPTWGLRPGLQIGGKATIRRGSDALLKRLFAARKKKIPSSCFDAQGNFSFGIPEYIDIEGMQYDPELKIMGLEVAVTLERPGFRVKRRKIQPGTVGENHLITREEAIAFVQQEFGVEVE